MRIVFFMVCCLTGFVANAQTPQEAEREVMQVVFKLFEGMRLADSSMIRQSFYAQAQMFTATQNAEGKAVLVAGDLSQFISSVGKAQPGMLNEPLWDYEVKIDHHFASVWTKYAFYYGDRFSHCGVDAFHLLRTDAGWKIFHLTDTRQKEGCDVPEEIKQKFEKK